MFLESLETENFRNLRGKLLFENGLNIFFGDNGQGKTNWLEAIYVLATTKSLKTARLPEAINFGKDVAWVRGSVHHGEDIHRVLQVSVQLNAKTLLVNGKSEAVSRYLGQLHAFIFTNSELEIVRGTPEHRRKFLDGGIVGIYPAFIQTLSDYNRVVKQKNSLLKSSKDHDLSLEKVREQLAPWNEQLVHLATRIHKARIRYVEILQKSLEKKLFEKEEVAIRYASALESKGDLANYADLLTERLNLRVQAELASGYALLGTHRDDLEIKFDGHDIRTFGSSGQQRSALLILQLASIALYHEKNGEYPLFLLDDIDAELDKKRLAKLLEFLEGKTQTFITTSKENLVEEFGGKAKIFQVQNGEVVISE